MQTPQAFRGDRLRAAHDSAPVVTDDAAAIEAVGSSVVCIPGEAKNRKLTTTRGDLRSCECVVSMTMRYVPRTGLGYDIHPFEAGRALRLGGITIESDRGLAGHSDGDAVLHAVTDALLAATGGPDLGSRFPASDDQYRDVDSTDLLARSFPNWQRTRYVSGTLRL